MLLVGSKIKRFIYGWHPKVLGRCSGKPRSGVWLEPLSPEWLSKHIVKTKLKALFLWGMNKGYAKRLVNEISFLYKTSS